MLFTNILLIVDGYNNMLLYVYIEKSNYVKECKPGNSVLLKMENTSKLSPKYEGILITCKMRVIKSTDFTIYCT